MGSVPGKQDRNAGLGMQYWDVVVADFREGESKESRA